MKAIAATALLASALVLSQLSVAAAGPTKPDVSDATTVNDCETKDTPVGNYDNDCES